MHQFCQKIDFMNIQQLEYAVAVGKHRNFTKAADVCCVTQPTLSMMLGKLEDELGVRLFDRSKSPIRATPVGEKILQQAQQILREVARLKEIVQEEKGEVEGHLHIGIIPTLAPYLLPLFLRHFRETYPQVHLKISEYMTETLVAKLEDNTIDMGILVGSLQNAQLKEHHLFFEGLILYSADDYTKEYLLPEDIDLERLLLLEEGHCLRSQISRLCELRQHHKTNLDYEAGSLETLKQLVERGEGITILPELATLQLSENQRKRLKHFQPPTPVREVCIATHQSYVRLKMLEAVRQSILGNLPTLSAGKENIAKIEI